MLCHNGRGLPGSTGAALLAITIAVAVGTARWSLSNIFEAHSALTIATAVTMILFIVVRLSPKYGMAYVMVSMGADLIGVILVLTGIHDESRQALAWLEALATGALCYRIARIERAQSSSERGRIRD